MDFNISKCAEYISYFSIFIFLIYPFVLPSMHWDEATYLLAGSWIAKGSILNVDFFDNKLPFIYYVSSFLVKIYDFNFILYRFTIVSLYLISAFIFSEILKDNVKRHFSFFFFLLISFLVGVYPYSLTETYSVFFLLLAFYFLKKENLVLAGFFLGVSSSIRHLLIFPFGVLILYYIFSIKDKKILIKKITLLLFSFLITFFLLLYLYFNFLGVESLYNFIDVSNSYSSATIKGFYVILTFNTNYTRVFTFFSFLIFYLMVFKVYISLFNYAKNNYIRQTLLFSLALLLPSFLFLIYLELRFFYFSFLLFLVSFFSLGEEKRKRLMVVFGNFLDKNSLFVVLAFVLILVPIFSMSWGRQILFFQLYQESLKSKKSLDLYPDCKYYRSYISYFHFIFNKYKPIRELTYYSPYLKYFNKRSAIEYLNNKGCFVEYGGYFPDYLKLIENYTSESNVNNLLIIKAPDK